MGENIVALPVDTSYHRSMTLWNCAKRAGYMHPSSQRELVLTPGRLPS
jgi:hypothetical protein